MAPPGTSCLAVTKAVDPDRAAVLLDQPCLEPIRVDLAGDETPEARNALGVVVGMRVARNGHQRKLVWSVACDGLHRLVAVDDVSVGVQERDAEG